MAQAELKAIATLDTKNFEQGAKRIGAASTDAGKAIGGGFSAGLGKISAAIGAAFTVGAAVNWTRNMASAAAETTRTANAVGLSVEQFAAFQDVVRKTGGNTEGFSSAIAKVVDSQEEAVLGNKQVAESFARLGIPMRQLQTLNTAELMQAIAQGAQDDATAVSDLNNVMGKDAARNYSAALQDLAANGLPAVDASLRKTIDSFARVNALYEEAKVKVQRWGMSLVVAAGQRLGLLRSDAEYADQAEAEDRKRQTEQQRRIAGLQEERRRKLELQRAEITGKEAKRLGELREREAEAIRNISVAAPQAADRLARIGGMVGGQATGWEGAAQRQLKQLEIIRKTQEDSLKVLEDTRTELRKMNEE